MRATTWCLGLLCSAVLALPVAAQAGAGTDETPPKEAPEAEKQEATPPATPVPAPKTNKNLGDPPLHRWGGWTISLAGWSPALVGANDEIGVAFPLNGGAPYPLTIGASSSLRPSWVIAYHLPKNLGSIVSHYDSMNFDDQVQYSSPGDFRFLETQTYPLYAGAFDNGFADTVSGQETRKTREFRLEWSDVLVESKRTLATWSAGYRNVDNNDQLQIAYYALVPNLPPIIPPIVSPPYPDPAQYAPMPDHVYEQSDFSGSGVGGALDVEFRIVPRFSFISGLSIGLLRGKLSTYYSSQTSYYYSALEPDHVLTPDELFAILQVGTPEQVASIHQQVVPVAFAAQNVSQAAQTFDGYFGVQSDVWRGLRVFVTYRMMYYQNVRGLQVPKSDGSVEFKSLSEGYEGYLLGLSWRF